MPRFEVIVEAQVTVSALMVIDAKDVDDARIRALYEPAEWNVVEDPYDRTILNLEERNPIEPKLTGLETQGDAV